jgi:hypothetical protein
MVCECPVDVDGGQSLTHVGLSGAEMQWRSRVSSLTIQVG